MQQFFDSLKMLKRFFKVIWKYRWYDYGFDLDLLLVQLKIKRDYWGKCHYEGFEEDLKTIDELIEMLEKIIDLEGSAEECEVRWKNFWNLYRDNLSKFWD